MVEFSKKIHSLPRVVFDQNCGELSCSSISFCDRELKNCIAAKAAQFLYETCAPYQRYGQGFMFERNSTTGSKLPSYVHFVDYAVVFYTAAKAA